jgi:hypothetical protein
MWNINDDVYYALKAPAREITGALTYFSPVDNEQKWIYADGIKNFTIEKTSPSGKLFGFAVSQKITIELVGSVTDIKKGVSISPFVYPKGYSSTSAGILADFYTESVEYNRVKNVTKIIGYDFLHKLDSIPVGDVEITYPLYALNYALDLVEPYRGYVEFEGINHLIREAPNANPTDSIRSVLISLAEFTGSICYVTYGNNIKFRAMKAEEVMDVITPDDYFDLTVGTEPVRLTMLGTVNEFNNNVYYYGTNGYSQVFRENPFMYRDDVNLIIDRVGGQVMSVETVPYKLSWRGNPSYELGDYIILQDIDGNANFIRWFNETLIYDGGLKSSSDWTATESDNIDIAPRSISTSIKSTVAKVDKINQEITLLAEKVENSDAGYLSQEVASLKVTTDAITADVSRLFGDLDTFEESVNAKLSRDNLSIIFKEEMTNQGVGTQIVTSTGYKFDKDGLNISKYDNPINTTITENGMYIKDSGVDILIANNSGVVADRLTAKTYLDIQNKVIFIDYGNRMGCFWIGGNE